MYRYFSRFYLQEVATLIIAAHTKLHWDDIMNRSFHRVNFTECVQNVCGQKVAMVVQEFHSHAVDTYFVHGLARFQ